MIAFFKRFAQADAKTKWFYAQWLIYGGIIILSTIYIYARLDFDRSYPIESNSKLEQTSNS